MKIYNMESNSGKPIAHQYILQIGINNHCKYVFQSYKTVIAYTHKNKIVIDNHAEEYSRTTSKYLYMFLREYCGININNKKELQKAVENKQIERQNLKEYEP